MKLKKNDTQLFLFQKNTQHWPWEDKDLPRVIANLEFERFVKDNKLNTCQKGLAINGIDPEWVYINAKNIIQIDYLDNPSVFDLHILDLPEKDFDYVLCCQTIEHVYNPLMCLKNIYAHMCKGGVLYINAPGDTIPHDTPIHFYTGFTPIGLAVLLKLAGFQILHIGSWGNKEYLSKMHLSNSWPDYKQFTVEKNNDFECTPAIVWAFARK